MLTTLDTAIISDLRGNLNPPKIMALQPTTLMTAAPQMFGPATKWSSAEISCSKMY